jgi:DTW domain-containing protein
VETRTRVLILQHPREHEKAVNTARIAALALPSAELVVGVDFSSSRVVNEAIASRERPAVLLYPGPQARDLERDPPSGPVTLVVVDGTWHQARSLLRKNPHLLALPHYAFAPDKPSEYRIRREPRPEYVSTIEALACALPLLEGEPARFAALLAPFRAMVELQLSYAARSTGARKRERRRNGPGARSRLPNLLLAPELVCVTGEANAFPYRRTSPIPNTPHELVHWLAVRCASDVRFEAFAKPIGPLASSPIVHSRIPIETLLSADSPSALVAGFGSFMRDEDVICTWGNYASGLFERERGAAFERVIDTRKVVGDLIKKSPGSIESLIAERKLSWQPLGSGRGGERLGMLAAVTRWLCDEARAQLSPDAQPPESAHASDALPALATPPP